MNTDSTCCAPLIENENLSQPVATPDRAPVEGAPKGYRKILFVLKDYSVRRRETLAEYYIRTKSHLIPTDVEIWEFDENKKNGMKLK